MGSGQETQVWNKQLQFGYIKEPHFVSKDIQSFSGKPREFPEYKGKKLCTDCAMGLFGYEKINTDLPALLECESGRLFKDEFSYMGIEFPVITMIKAERVQHSLVISFKPNTINLDRLTKKINVPYCKDENGVVKLTFDVASRPSKLSAAGLILFGDIASMEAGRQAMQTKVDSSIQLWVTTINMLIAMSQPQPSMPVSQTKIYCTSCGTENSVEATFCFKCGKKILKA